MKEKSLRRTSKAAREAAEQELKELLPTLESVAAEPDDKQAAMKKSADRARVEKTMAYTVERVTREISDLQLSAAQAQVQALAVKAIEGAAAMKSPVGP